MKRFVNFLGLPWQVQLNTLTAFLRMLFSSKMKLGSALALISLTFFAEVISSLFYLEYIEVQLVYFVVVCNSWCRVDVVYFFYDVFDCVFK